MIWGCNFGLMIRGTEAHRGHTPLRPAPPCGLSCSSPAATGWAMRLKSGGLTLDPWVLGTLLRILKVVQGRYWEYIQGNLRGTSPNALIKPSTQISKF